MTVTTTDDRMDMVVARLHIALNDKLGLESESWVHDLANRETWHRDRKPERVS